MKKIILIISIFSFTLFIPNKAFSDERNWIRNVYASDYLYRYVTIYKNDSDFSYFRNSINFGSVFYCIMHFLKENDEDTVFSVAEILSLATEFDKISDKDNNTLIVKYFQSVPEHYYAFSAAKKSDDGNICFKIDYYRHEELKKTGWFVYLKKYEAYRYFNSEPNNINVIANHNLKDDERSFFLLYLLFNNLWSMYANNAGINNEPKQFSFINISFDEYIKIITPMIKGDATYKVLLNSLFEELSLVFPDDPMNCSVLVNCMFEKMIQDSL